MGKAKHKHKNIFECCKDIFLNKADLFFIILQIIKDIYVLKCN